MKVIAKKNRELALINAQNTQNENRAEIITLVVPEEYEDYNKKIVFITDDETVWDVITNNEYKITNAITKYEKVDFYIWLTKEVDGESIDFRTKTKTLNFYHNVDASDEITDEEIHGVNTVVNLLEEEIEKVENLNIEATKIGDTTTVTITKKDGTTESVEINDGTDGQDGQDGYTPQKGIDYFTEQDTEEIENGVKNDLQETVLVDYSLITETGSKIELSINTTDYKLKAILKDKNNNIIHTSNVIDLPLETMVVNATYDNVNKAIILTLQNGTTVSISVADLVSGLVSESQLQTILSNYYTKTEINNLLNNKVDKVQGKELSSNDFTDTLKEKLEGLENYDDTEIKADISDIQDEQIEQNTEIENLQTENARLKATLPTTTGEGQDITLDKTAELEFKKPPLPMGNSEQVQYSGKQLFNINQERIDRSSESQILNNTLKIITSGTWAGTDFLGVSVIANQSYKLTFSWESNISISGTDARIYIYSGNEIGTLLDYINLTGTSGTVSKSFTPTTDKISIRFSPNNTGETKTVTMNFKEIMISTNGGDYEPYVGGTASPNPDYPQEITNVTGDVEVKVQNKNLFDYNYVKEYSNTIFNSYRFIEIKGIKASTWYTIYNYGNLEGFNNVYFADDTKYEAIRFGTLLNNRTSRDVQVSEAGKLYLCCYAGTWTETVWNTFIDNFKNAILIQGRNVESNNIPHQEQTFTFPLGNEKLMLGDYLADDGIHHVRGQVVFDGSNDENWNYEELSYGNNFYIKISNAKGGDEIPILSNCFKYYEHGRLNSNYSCKISALKNLNLRHEDFSNINDFKIWLSTHNVIVEYELEQEEITPYTTEQQEVYNQIKQALSYEEQTNISSNTIALFDVEAYQSTKLVLEERDAKYESLEARVALLE